MEHPRRDKSFDYFSKPGHFKDYSDRIDVFLDQLHYELGKLKPGSTVLDVGCGHGIHLDQKPQFEIAKRVGTYWGIEPDKGVQPASCFHRIWQSSLEDADVPDASVDFAYSQMVLEHVTEPGPFLNTLARILKPGGVFLSLTVNADSTFARISGACHRLGIQDAVLVLTFGKKKVDEYHYPAVYEMTSPSVLQKLVKSAGLSEVKITLLEADEWLYYFPKGTKWMGKIISGVLQRRVPNYTWMLARIQK